MNLKLKSMILFEAILALALCTQFVVTYLYLDQYLNQRIKQLERQIQDAEQSFEIELKGLIEGSVF